jgi:hypothetical protein
VQQMNDHKKNRVLIGSLRTKSMSLEHVRCEMQLNIHDTSSMKADVYDLDGTITFRFMKDFMGKNVVFQSSADNEEITFHGTVTTGQISDSSDRIGSVRIDSYQENSYLNREPLRSASFIFYLTPIEMFKRTRMQYLHDMKGILFGYDDWTNAEKPVWKDESYSYPTKVGDLVFYPGLIFEEGDRGSVTVTDQVKMVISVRSENIAIESTRAEIEGTLQDYIHIASFLENRFVHWFRCDIDARSSNGKGMVASIYKRIPKWNYRTNQYVERNSEEYRQLLPKLVDKYVALDPPKKLELDKAIRQMLVAAKPDQPVDSELIYWHSCLDILVKGLSGDKASKRKGMGFSRKLVLACEDAGIEWKDLYQYVTRDEIFSDELKADFKITTIRNNMIHDGNYPSDKEFADVFAENNRAATLAERMVLRIFGMDYLESPVGKFRSVR